LEDLMAGALQAQNPPDMTLDLDDIQGLILRGYKVPCARHLILKIVDAAGFRAFLKALLPAGDRSGNHSIRITTSAEWPHGVKPDCCVSLALTGAGLRTLVSPEAYEQLNQATSDAVFEPFHLGAARSAKVNGDVDESAPDHWWDNDSKPDGAKLADEHMHVVLSLYLNHDASREEHTQRVLNMIPAGPAGPAAVVVKIQDGDRLPGPAGDSVLHFGYRDGMSQPNIAGAPRQKSSSDGPVVPAYYFVIQDHAAAPYNAAPLFRNGSFSAFRILEQDVAAFEEFLAEAAGPGGDPELIAAKVCGRWRNGTPLSTHPDAPVETHEGDKQNDFNFLTPTEHQPGDRNPDPLGAKCPVSSHIRRANPRDDGAVTFNLQMAERRRIIRRGMPYGPPYGNAPGAKRGLVGHFICASLLDQFEFIQSQWLFQGSFRSPDPSPNQSGVDPLFGAHPSQTVPQYLAFSWLKPDGTYADTLLRKRFITTRGALYTWIPSISALAQLAEPASP
jgi:deferrochelatase/peroxidase EfeB